MIVHLISHAATTRGWSLRPRFTMRGSKTRRCRRFLNGPWCGSLSNLVNLYREDNGYGSKPTISNFWPTSHHCQHFWCSRSLQATGDSMAEVTNSQLNSAEEQNGLSWFSLFKLPCIQFYIGFFTIFNAKQFRHCTDLRTVAFFTVSFQEWRPQNTRRAMSKTRRGHEPSLLWHMIWVWFKIGIQEIVRKWAVYFWKCSGFYSPKNTLSEIYLQTAGTKHLNVWSFVELIWPPSASNVLLRCSITIYHRLLIMACQIIWSFWQPKISIFQALVAFATNHSRASQVRLFGVS